MQPRIISRSDHPISRKNIDADALKVLYRLYRSGHTAFLVGGGVRDLLIGRHPKDFDISTSARPGQVKKLFRNCWLIGRRFRLAHIHFRDHKIVEVSTFRAQPERGDDGDEDLLVRQDNTFGTPEEDALRRDFTINGLFYDIASFSLIDYVGGVDDIEAGVIRTIGDPNVRFREDPVRMLRAIKFAARLDFAIEPETWEAICEHAEEITRCSTSRVVEEIARLLEGGASCRSLQLLKASGLLRIVLPEVFEYIQGVPAGPGLQPEARGEARETSEALEVELLLDADEDTDPELQERILGVDGQPLADEGDQPEESSEAAETSIEDGGDLSDGGAGEGDDLELAAGDEGETDLLTPQGTRCVQAPDRGALLWRTLASVDARVRGGCPMTRPALYAALLHPLVRHSTEWVLSEHAGKDEERTFLGLLRPLTSTVIISRRERERVCQILAAQRKFRRNNRGFAQALSRKPYFSEALDVCEVSTLATGDGVEPLAWWRSRYPYVAPVVSSGRARLQTGPAEGRDEAPRRSRRRRRSGRGEEGRDIERDVESSRSARRDSDDSPRRYEGDAEREEGTRGRRRDGEGSDRGRRRIEVDRSERDRSRGRSRDAEAPRQRSERIEDRGRGGLRRRDVRDIEGAYGGGRSEGRLDYGRGELRRESAGRGGAGDRTERGARGRSGNGAERSGSRRTPYREEGYRGPRAGDDEREYYEARVGRDLTAESPRPRRDDARRGTTRRRRRKPPASNR